MCQGKLGLVLLMSVTVVTISGSFISGIKDHKYMRGMLVGYLMGAQQRQQQLGALGGPPSGQLGSLGSFYGQSPFGSFAASNAGWSVAAQPGLGQQQLGGFGQLGGLGQQQGLGYQVCCCQSTMITSQCFRVSKFPFTLAVVASLLTGYLADCGTKKFMKGLIVGSLLNRPYPQFVGGGAISQISPISPVIPPAVAVGPAAITSAVPLSAGFGGFGGVPLTAGFGGFGGVPLTTGFGGFGGVPLTAGFGGFGGVPLTTGFGGFGGVPLTAGFGGFGGGFGGLNTLAVGGGFGGGFGGLNTLAVGGGVLPFAGGVGGGFQPFGASINPFCGGGFGGTQSQVFFG
ncbi:hypothetical protein HDE_13988 [Halotydeus destructor]|nr:hypothetical protein HDE_13988 [Halotydeus destructor]